MNVLKKIKNLLAPVNGSGNDAKGSAAVTVSVLSLSSV